MKTNECISKTLIERMYKTYEHFGQYVGIKRLFAHKDGKVDITFLFNGDESEFGKFRIFINSHFPTEDTCCVIVKNKDNNYNYDYKIELIDVLVG